jgi:hypothetical protein
VTDEQTPGQPPQDPSQGPAQPTPGQPPADSPPPPPVNPYEQQQPSAPPTYGQPAPPPYGEPAAAPPAYGQPAAPAYGQPVPPPYGQPAMAAGSYPGGMAEPEPSKAMAITALILSLLCCFPLGLMLAIVVLVRSRDGRNHGKGLAIGAIVASIVSAVALSAGVYGLTQVDWEDLLPVEQLETGECLNASNLTDDSEDFVEDIDEVSCSDAHDAEVLVTKDLTQDDARDYDPASSTLCTDLITEGGLADKVAPTNPEIGYFGLTTDEAPDAGDKLVCIAYRLDGAKLDAPL